MRAALTLNNSSLAGHAGDPKTNDAMEILAAVEPPRRQEAKAKKSRLEAGGAAEMV